MNIAPIPAPPSPAMPLPESTAPIAKIATGGGITDSNYDLQVQATIGVSTLEAAIAAAVSLSSEEGPAMAVLKATEGGTAGWSVGPVQLTGFYTLASRRLPSPEDRVDVDRPLAFEQKIDGDRHLLTSFVYAPEVVTVIDGTKMFSPTHAS